MEKLNMPDMSLGDRMKIYEKNPSTKLERGVPTIIRLDGKSFSKYVKTVGFEKPFDVGLSDIMNKTTAKLVENIQGCVFGYTQSDEITLLLIDYANKDGCGWFDYKVQKMTSISASIATYWFNRYVTEYSREISSERAEKILDTPAYFDSRVFQLPLEEVNNCFLWRERDAIRNSILNVGQSVYSHKEMFGVKTDALKEKLRNEKNIDWDSLPLAQQRGVACYRSINYSVVIDKNIPLFSEDPQFINKFIIVGKHYLKDALVGETVYLQGNGNRTITDAKWEYGEWFVRVDDIGESWFSTKMILFI